ncbi:MAG: glycosyltransferase family 1 protein [Candidatus Lustribacter sp.]
MISVALDARITPRMSAGVRTYVRALLDGLPRVAPDIELHAVGHGLNFGLDEQLRLPAEIDRLAPALTHYPTIFAPVRRRRPYVAMVHDLIHLQYPQFFGFAAAAFYAVAVKPMLRGAELLLMSDERTADACVELLGVERTRCRVVPLGYDPGLFAPAEARAPRRPYIMYAGNHRPHKNLDVLYEAWAGLPPAVELDLVITGAPDAAALERYRRPGSELRYAGTLTDAHLVAGYRAATAYVHPALAEGFGLPMLEAAVAGTPVIASTTAVPAIVAPYAATFAPHDTLALRALLTDLAANPAPYRRRAAEGHAALRAYTWDRFAAATAAVYREVVDGSSRT